MQNKINDVMNARTQQELVSLTSDTVKGINELVNETKKSNNDVELLTANVFDSMFDYLLESDKKHQILSKNVIKALTETGINASLIADYEDVTENPLLPFMPELIDNVETYTDAIIVSNDIGKQNLALVVDNNKQLGKLVECMNEKESETTTINSSTKPLLLAGPENEKKDKKDGFSMKTFMSGFFKIFAKVLSPVAIVTAFIAKFLPWIILLVSFMRGFIDGLVERYGGKIYVYLTLAIAGLVTALIAIWSVRTYGFITVAKWIWKLELVQSAKKYALNVASFMYEKGLALATFLLEKICILGKIAMAIITFILDKARIILQILFASMGYLALAAGVILIVGAVLFIIKSLFELIFGTVIDLGAIFTYIGDMFGALFDMLASIPEILFGLFLVIASVLLASNPIGLLIMAFAGVLMYLIDRIFGGGKKDEKIDSKEKQDIGLDETNTQNMFEILQETISTPLMAIQELLAEIVNNTSKDLEYKGQETHYTNMNGLTNYSNMMTNESGVVMSPNDKIIENTSMPFKAQTNNTTNDEKTNYDANLNDILAELKTISKNTKKTLGDFGVNW